MIKMQEIKDYEWLAQQLRELFHLCEDYAIPACVTDQMRQSLMFDADSDLHAIACYSAGIANITRINQDIFDL